MAHAAGKSVQLLGFERLSLGIDRQHREGVVREIWRDRADMAANLDDMGTIAHKMRSQNLPDRCRRARQMRQILAGSYQLRRLFKGLKIHEPAAVAPQPRPTYNMPMPHATPPPDDIWRDRAFDLARGLAVYSGSALVAGIARVIAKHQEADIATAFNQKQVACKVWARDRLFDALGGRYERIWIVGGWYGVLAAMLMEDPRFDIAEITSIDIDPAVAQVARTLFGDTQVRFRTVTADMYKLDFAAGGPDLVINTSCEHIVDLRQWLGLIPSTTPVLLQSNNYFSEPTHINCMESLDQFITEAGLRQVNYAGELPQKNYTRFMLIGKV